MEISVTKEVAWEKFRERLRKTYSEETYSVWFAPLSFDAGDAAGEDRRFPVRVPSEFVLIWLQDNYLPQMRQILEYVSNGSLDLELSCPSSDTSETPVSSPVERSGIPAVPGPRAVENVKRIQVSSFPLNPKNSFDNFVVGSNNQMAHAASVAVASNPGKAYNPLFIYGGTGLGKTHLMQAVGHFVQGRNSQARVAYLTSEKFTNDYISALAEKTPMKFRQKYRNVDVLLVDDIQFLSGKEGIQEEFFHTFNDLFECQKQIILTSDRPASEIIKLENRLVSRISWGLVTDIGSPDYETRRAILERKLQQTGCAVDPEVVEFIAQRVTSHIRNLEGALTRVISYANLVGEKVDVSRAEDLLKDVIQVEMKSRVDIHAIQQVVCSHFGISIDDMNGRSRQQRITFPRHIAMFLSRLITDSSLQEIGACFGGRDHGTVMHAFRNIKDQMIQNKSVDRTVKHLQNALSSR